MLLNLYKQCSCHIEVHCQQIVHILKVLLCQLCNGGHIHVSWFPCNDDKPLATDLLYPWPHVMNHARRSLAGTSSIVALNDAQQFKYRLTFSFFLWCLTMMLHDLHLAWINMFGYACSVKYSQQLSSTWPCFFGADLSLSLKTTHIS